jgi:superoxide dismutase, Cu-Zn family
MRQQVGLTLCAMLLAAAITLPASAADTVVTMKKLTPDGTGETLGTITLANASGGVTFKIDLHDLTPGPHGFHAHENGACGPTLSNGVSTPGGAAGGHFDPDRTGKHAGPAGSGHKGDLPVLEVAADGTARQTLAAPHVSNVDTLKGHALVVHVGGDNYSDSPAPLGGGGGRFACGVVQ